MNGETLGNWSGEFDEKKVDSDSDDEDVYYDCDEATGDKQTESSQGDEDAENEDPHDDENAENEDSHDDGEEEIQSSDGYENTQIETSHNDEKKIQSSHDYGEKKIEHCHQDDDNDVGDKDVQSLYSLPPPTTTNDAVKSDQSESEDPPKMKHPLHAFPALQNLVPSLNAVDTWDEITKRDRPVSNETLVHVMDHSMAMLGERICEATNENNFRDSLKAFEHKVGKFRNAEIDLGRRIASGSFADIYRVHSFHDFGGTMSCTDDQARAATLVKQDNPERYVVKVLRKTLLLKKSLFATGAADFITEGTLLASFDHPHIISIKGRSVNGVEGFSSGKRDSLFFVLERMNGDLTHKLQEWKKKTSEHGLFAKGRRNNNISILCERLELMSDLAGALAYLHERNVIHRDIALGNVGISYDSGKAKLLDFGLAKVLPHSMNGSERFLLTGKTGSVR